jgi:hypothetical protein
MSATVQFKWTPHHRQREVIDSDHRFRVLNWGRRTGKNEVAIVETVRYALEHAGEVVWWVAPSYQQADDYGFGRMREMLPGALVRGEPKLTNPKEIELVNDTVISFKSAEKPKNLKGAGVDYMVVDEAASIPGDIWYEYLRPTLTDTLGEAVIISTPKGKDWFYDLFKRGEDDDDASTWSTHATSFENPHVPDSEIEQQRETIPERVFKQEYLAEFVDDAGSVFVDIPIEDYAYEDRPGTSPYRIGVDYARHHDWTVVTVLDTEGYVVEFKRVNETSWHAIQTVIENVYERYNPATVQVDATRDNKITEDLEASGVPVEGVRFTASEKAAMIEDLAAMLETEDIVVPEGATQLRHELEAYEYEVTSHGNVKYSAPDHTHDDAVDSLALAATCEEPMSATW